MKLLVISQMFPCKRHPTSAIFFANLLKELAPRLEKLTVVTPRPYIPRVLTRIKKKWARWYIDPMISADKGMEIIRPYFLCMRGISYEGVNGLLMYYSLIKLLRRLHKERQFDLVLGHNLLPDGTAAVGLAKKLNLPAVIWCKACDVQGNQTEIIRNPVSAVIENPPCGGFFYAAQPRVTLGNPPEHQWLAPLVHPD